MISLSKLSVKNLSKSYANLEVLKDISLTIKKGEFVSIIGASGCGKSTLFNIIAGVEKETTGSIAINGKTLADRTGHTGYMPQSPLLLPWRTVEENVLLGLDIRREDRKIAQKKAHALLQKFGLHAFSNKYPRTLSGGMAQRIALLRTVLFQQHFLLLDEPFGALDALTRLSMQTWLLEVWNEFHSSVLFITHDVREAIFLSDRIYVLSTRPATILKEVIVDLPRVRKPKDLASKKARELEKKLLGLLFK